MLDKAFKLMRYGLWAMLLGAALSGGVVAAAYYSTLEELPDVDELKQVTFETPMKIYTSDGKLIGEFGEHKRIPVKLEQIPQKMQQAFLAIEDSRFYEHSGIDPIGILRALAVAVTSGGASQGASTITQQVARNFFLTRDKTLERKVKEVFIAWRIEQVLSKEEIFELYLNKIALGHRSYGVVAAAQTYYGKSLEDLSLAEIATIAGLPKAPSTLNPITSPERARDRRHLVLQRMRTLGFITDEEFEIADAAPSKAYFHSTPLEAYAPYVAEEARIAVLAKYGEEAYTKGFKIYTTVDSNYQRYAHDAIFKNLTAYDQRHGYRGPLYNIYDSTRGVRGSAKKATEKTGLNANANNGIIMDAREGLRKSAAQSGKPLSYQQVVAEIDKRNLLKGSAEYAAIQAMSREQLLDRLMKEDKYESIDLALVTVIDDANKQVGLLYPNGSEKVLTWEGMSWARAFKTDRSQGALPTYPSEFLLPGDIVFTFINYVDRKATKNQPARTDEVITLTQLPDVESALIALDPRNGAVRAMAGGFDYEKSKFNRTTQLLRQTGSNFKPFIYSSAIAYGISTNSVIPDVPIKTWDVGSRTWWEPRNSPNRFDGPMTLREGLARSKNSIAIRTIRHVGVENAVKHLRKFDIFVPPFQQSESMALGSMELTPLQMATSFSAFANGGYKLTPYLIDRIELENGEVLYQAHPRLADPNLPDIIQNGIPLEYVKNYQPNPRDLALAELINNTNKKPPKLDENGQPTGTIAAPVDENGSMLINYPAKDLTGPQASVAALSDLDTLAHDGGPYKYAPQILSHSHAYIVASLMKSNIYGGVGINGPYWGTGSRAGTITGRTDLHGKTGTTNNVHDAWFSGFNGNLVVASWVGFDNDRNLGYSIGKGSESGGATALPIFADFFKKAQEGVPEAQIPRPKGIVYTTNRGITEASVPGMMIIDEGSASSSVKNTGIDSSDVSGDEIF